MKGVPLGFPLNQGNTGTQKRKMTIGNPQSGWTWILRWCPPQGTFLKFRPNQNRCACEELKELKKSMTKDVGICLYSLPVVVGCLGTCQRVMPRLRVDRLVQLRESNQPQVALLIIVDGKEERKKFKKIRKMQKLQAKLAKAEKARLEKWAHPALGNVASL